MHLQNSFCKGFSSSSKRPTQSYSSTFFSRILNSIKPAVAGELEYGIIDDPSQSAERYYYKALDLGDNGADQVQMSDRSSFQRNEKPTSPQKAANSKAFRSQPLKPLDCCSQLHIEKPVRLIFLPYDHTSVPISTAGTAPCWLLLLQ